MPIFLSTFRPLLAGATFNDRLLACVGAMLGIGLIAGCSAFATPFHPLLVAPIGASAVLVFALPTSPLAQPWPVIGGNGIAALVGVSAGLLIDPPGLAAVLAVPLAILAMTLARSLHPPGGAVALLVATTGAQLPMAGGVIASSILLIGVGLAFHRLTGRSYPHRPDPAAARRELASGGLIPEDIDRALADLRETFDISREDLALLLARAEHHASRRRGT